jgi:hypothetical protein
MSTRHKTDWARASANIGGAPKAKKFLKRQNHKKNRAAAKKLDNVYIRLNGWALD